MPSVSAGEPIGQVANPKVLVVASKLEVDLRYPPQNVVVNGENNVSQISPIGEPFESNPRERPTKLFRIGISSFVRLQQAMMELWA